MKSVKIDLFHGFLLFSIQIMGVESPLPPPVFVRSLCTTSVCDGNVS